MLFGPYVGRTLGDLGAYVVADLCRTAGTKIALALSISGVGQHDPEAQREHLLRTRYCLPGPGRGAEL